jgi:chorismate-pyruvate lyase
VSAKISAGLSQSKPPDAGLPPSPGHWLSGDEFLRSDSADRMDPILRMLLMSDGTVTTSLQALIRTPISVEVFRHKEIRIDQATAEFLTAKPGSDALARDVCLTGKGRRLVYASSIIVLEGLRGPLLEALLTGEKPLGSLLQESGEPVMRDRLQIACIADPSGIKWIGLGGPGPIWMRRYRMTIPSNSTALIQEQFAGDLIRS